MLDILSSYLTEATSHETKILIEEAHVAFDRIALPNYEDGYVDIIMTADNVAISEPVDKIISLTLEIQRQLLKDHEIVLIPDATIAMHTLVINGLMDIEEYEDVATLLKTVSMQLEPNELFAEVLALVTKKNADELLSEIESVGTSLIGKIKDITEVREVSETDTDRILKQKHIELLNKFCNYINTRNLDIVRIITSGLGVAYPFVVYANAINELENKSVDDISYELLAAAYVSSDGYENPLNVIKAYIEVHISDIDKITKIAVRVSDLLLGLQR